MLLSWPRLLPLPDTCTRRARAAHDSSSEGAASSARRPLPSDRPSRPDSSFRARSTSSTDSPCSRWTKRSSARIDRAGSSRHRDALEGREAHCRIDRASALARPSPNCHRRGGRRPGADSHQRHPEAQTPARQTTARTARGSRSAGFPTPRATSAVARRSRPRSGIVAWNEPCRRPRRAARWERHVSPRRCPQAPVRCEGERSSRSSPIDARTASSISVGSTRCLPPWTTRWPTASMSGEERASNDSTASNALVWEDKVELEARRAGVDDEDRPHGLRTARSSRGSRDRRRRARV